MKKAETRRGHILILVQNLPVPFDRRVWMESLALRDAGYKVSVISPLPPKDDRTKCEIDGISLYRYAPPAETSGKLSFVREFAYCYLQTRRLVRQVWKDDPFDALQSCNPPDTFWHIGRKYKSRGVKYVFDHHDLCPELYISKFGRTDAFYKALCWLERRQFQTADGVIATNESYREVAIQRGGVRPDAVSVVRSGPMISQFKRTPPDPALRRGRKYLVVYLGVMGVQDGVDYALRAIRHALDAGLTDTSFTFIGSGDEFSRLVKLCSSLGLDGHVLFTGRISDDELRRYLSTADLGIAPDPKNPLNDVSTMNKMVEYMAMGIPIVSFDLKESRVSADGAALYIPDDRTDLMGKAMIELLGDPARRQRMGEVGTEKFKSALAWDYSRTKLVSFYDRLLEKPRTVATDYAHGGVANVPQIVAASGQS